MKIRAMTLIEVIDENGICVAEASKTAEHLVGVMPATNEAINSAMGAACGRSAGNAMSMISALRATDLIISQGGGQ